MLLPDTRILQGLPAAGNRAAIDVNQTACAPAGVAYQGARQEDDIVMKRLLLVCAATMAGCDQRRSWSASSGSTAAAAIA